MRALEVSVADVGASGGAALAVTRPANGAAAKGATTDGGAAATLLARHEHSRSVHQSAQIATAATATSKLAVAASMVRASVS